MIVIYIYIYIYVHEADEWLKISNDPFLETGNNIHMELPADSVKAAVLKAHLDKGTVGSVGKPKERPDESSDEL